jgi:hypothetical protein
MDGFGCTARDAADAKNGKAAQPAYAADAPAGALKIGRFLAGAFSTYQCGSCRGAADTQPVGWLMLFRLAL